MDVDLSPQDLAFQEEVRDFLATNAHDPKTDYGQWRLNWFELAKAKGGWDVPKWPTAFGGPGWTPTQHYIWEKETPVGSALWPLNAGTGADELRQRRAAAAISARYPGP